MMHLGGTRIVVTGATNGLGRAMASALIEAGAHVAITGRERSRAEAVAAELGGGGVGIELDVRDQRSVQAGVHAAYARLGRQSEHTNTLRRTSAPAASHEPLRAGRSRSCSQDYQTPSGEATSSASFVDRPDALLCSR